MPLKPPFPPLVHLTRERGKTAVSVVRPGVESESGGWEYCEYVSRDALNALRRQNEEQGGDQDMVNAVRLIESELQFGAVLLGDTPAEDVPRPDTGKPEGGFGIDDPFTSFQRVVLFLSLLAIALSAAAFVLILASR